MKYWLITDTHFNHAEKMKEYCGRPDGYEEKMFKSMLHIDQDDILIHLGDVCIGQDKAMHEKYIIPLRCKKILVKGNHDVKSNNWYLRHGWDFVVEQFVIRFEGILILFSHKPVTEHNCDLNIHGHFHNKQYDMLANMYNLNESHRLLAVESCDVNFQATQLHTFIQRS